MPPKRKTRSARNEQTDLGSNISHSTAKIFQNGEVTVNNENIEVISPPKSEGEAKPEKNAVEQEFEEEDDYKDAMLITRVIYSVQDFLNENLNFLYFVQILVFGYIIQLSYLSVDKFENLKELAPVIGFNAIGVLIGIFFSYIRAREDDPTRKILPDFGYFYSVLLPLFVNAVHYNSKFFLINLCLNYYIIDRLNPVFSLLSSVVFYEMYNENTDITTFRFVQISVVHGMILFLLNYINDGNINFETDKQTEPLAVENKSFRKSEIQLLTLIVVNLFFNVGLTERFLPLLILQKLLISLLASVLVLYPLYAFIPSFVVMGLFGVLFYLLTNFQLKAVLNSNNSVLWLYSYIFEDELKLALIKIWVGILSVAIPVVFYNVDRFSLNIRRKIWHSIILLILVVSPTVLIDNIEFTLICLLGSVVLFLVVEIVRINQLTFIGKFLSDRLVKFQDFKDLKGPLNLSYIYLLIGISIPIVYDYILSKPGTVTVIRYMGIAALGLGDSFASIVGKKWGSFKWRGSEKSVQGTAAFIVSTFATLVLVDYYLTSSYPGTYVAVDKNWENLFVSVLISGILEATSDLNDNFFVPIILPISYEILNICFGVSTTT